MRKRLTPIPFLILTCLATLAFAETIELKNGEVVLGDILQETDKEVVISKQSGQFIYSIDKNRIRSIRESTPPESEKRKRKEARFYEVDRSADEARKKSREKYASERYEKQLAAASEARGITKVKFSGSRAGVVGATLNGKIEVPLLVDTGASLVVISGKTTKKLGFEITQDTPKVKMTLADGTEKKYPSITLDSVEVGNAKIEKVKAAVSETPLEEGVDGLLGMSFLRYFHVKLDSKENCLVLEKY